MPYLLISPEHGPEHAGVPLSWPLLAALNLLG
jgi:hypothetical protein